MKKFLLVATACLSSLYWVGCGDSNNNNGQFTSKKPAGDDYRSVAWQDARAMKATGKIFLRGNEIMVNEPYQGIHIIDNTDPKNPKSTKFLSVPGNVDMAMKDDILYVDNYDDLVAFNTKTNESNRVKGVFSSLPTQNGQMIAFEGTSSDPLGMNRSTFNAVQKGSGGSTTTNTSTGDPGVGGSMSRFAVVGNHLYVIDGDQMKVFDVTHAYSPKAVCTHKMDFTVETIFPYEDKLFIGGTQGMYVYDLSDPTNPQFMSKFEHIVSCDPVVVENGIAYVTLRGGTPCRGAQNELMVLDINDITNPTLVKSYPMHNPHGLAIDNGLLYICDGTQGLKVFDTADKNNITGNVVFTDHNIKTYDVIPNGNALIVVGKDGLYQYDRTDAKNMTMMSKITVERES